jgi:hypothetical protein
VVALDNQVRKQLHSEGLTELEVPCIATNASSWDQRAMACLGPEPCPADPFAQVDLPVMLDTGGVFYIYSADSYHMILVDRQGRLVAREICASEGCSVEIQRVKQRLRELYAE